MRWAVVVGVVLGVMLCAGAKGAYAQTETPTATATETPVPTATETPTATGTAVGGGPVTAEQFAELAGHVEGAEWLLFIAAGVLVAVWLATVLLFIVGRGGS